MGVPLFYKRVVEKHFPTSTSEQKPRCTTLAIDFAGIEHTVLAKHLENNAIFNEVNYLKELVYAVEELVRMVDVQIRLIICRDGMAPLAKMVNQRRRRFRHALESLGKDEKFDSNVLSPGTELSVKIDAYLTSTLSRRAGKSLPAKIVFSGYRVPGEGEHKIIEHIHEVLEDEPKKLQKLFNDLVRSYQLKSSKYEEEEEVADILTLLDLQKWKELDNDTILIRLKRGKRYLPSGTFEKFEKLFSTNESILIYGLDADLIFLTTALQGNIYLWRHNDYFNERKYERLLRMYKNDVKRARAAARDISNTYLNIKTLKTLLRNGNIGIEEFIMGGVIFGNDFLPFLPGFNIVDEISDLFIQNLAGKKFADPFNLVEFQKYLSSFENILPTLYSRLTGKTKANEERYNLEYPSRLSVENFEEEWKARMTFKDIIPADEVIVKQEEEFIFPSTNDDLKKYSIDYIKTVIWYFNYYKNHKNVSWKWAYYSYWSPPISEIIKIKMEDIKFDNLKFTLPDFNIAGQLLLILPRDLKTGEPSKIVPKTLRIFQENFSPIFDFYPKNFIINRDGVNRSPDGFPFLPQIDYERYIKSIEFVHYTVKEKDIYGTGSISNFNAAITHSSILEKESPITEKDTLYLISPSKLIKFNDLWKKKATELFGQDLMKNIIPYEERHFINPSSVEDLVIDFKKIEIKKKIF